VSITLPPGSPVSGAAVSQSWAIDRLEEKRVANQWDPVAKPINPITLLAWQAGVPMFRTNMAQTQVHSESW
jgi:hypothetical protein